MTSIKQDSVQASARASAAPTLRATPLHHLHAAAGAFFTEFGGWDMPLRYTSDLAEHHAVRTSAGIFDLSHMGEVRVRGPQAAAALDHALVGAISTVKVGRARYTMIVDEDGGILDDLIVYHVCREDFLVVPNAGNRERVAAALAERCAGFDCEVFDESESTALIAVQGPRAEEILGGVVSSGVGIEAALRPDDDAAGPGSPAAGSGGAGSGSVRECDADVLCGPTILRRLRYYAAVKANAAGHEILLARTGYTGEDGFELFCASADAVDLWETILAYAATLPRTIFPADSPAGAEDSQVAALTPCGLASRDSLRLEAGMPLYGHELSTDITPYDAGLGGVVALNKAEFVGRDALEKRSGREGEAGTRVVVALTGSGRRAARAGYPVLGPHGRQIGQVTSGLLSPSLGYPVALALVEPACLAAPEMFGDPAWPAGSELGVDVRGRRLPMRVVAPPFYTRPR